MERRTLFFMLTAGALLAGCATSHRPATGRQAPVTALSLPAEEKRLAELFRGTPVVFEMTANGSMRVEVPLRYSFDKGKSAVKPPLAKVLEYIAPSAKAPGMKARVLAPSDNGNPTQLAQDRAASTRDYLVSKGVPAAHFVDMGAAYSDAVEILVGNP